MTNVTAATGPGRGRVWFALLVVYLVWGSTFLGIAVVSHSVPPLLAAGARFTCAGILLALILAIFRGPKSLRASLREIAGASLTGIMLLTVGIGAVSLAVQYVPSGAAALLAATEPLWIIAFRAVVGQRPPRVTVYGVLLGLLGVGALVWFMGAADPDPGDGYLEASATTVVIWMIVVLLATVVWSWASFNSPRLTARGWAPSDPFTSTVYQFVAAGVALLIIGLISGENPAQLAHVDSSVVVAWLYIVLGAVAAFTCYVWLLQNVAISLVSTYAYVNPAVAVVLGYFVLSEPFGIGVLASMALVVAGVALVVRGERGEESAST